MSEIAELVAANREWSAAQEAKEAAEHRLEQAAEAVDAAKEKIATVEAPKLVGKAFRWVGSSGMAAAYLVVCVNQRGLSTLTVEQDVISDAAISLRRRAPHEFFEWIEGGYVVEISRDDFASEYARILALLSPKVQP
jgi:hypothetical protein